MDRDDIIRMAREAGLYSGSPRTPSTGSMIEKRLERFAALVAAAEREKVAAWMMARGYATGHGDTIEDLLQELDCQIAENWNRALIAGITTEREACAKLFDCEVWAYDYREIASAIRARGGK